MNLITRPLHGEKDFLIDDNLVNFKFFLKDLDGQVLFIQDSPVGGWSHDALEQIDCFKLAGDRVWDAYLVDGISEHWIGSSEI
jgi:hypothetical protein